VAAVEEEGGGESAARGDLGGALLDEAAERGEAWDFILVMHVLSNGKERVYLFLPQ
jgi:hypothetical protein